MSSSCQSLIYRSWNIHSTTYIYRIILMPMTQTDVIFDKTCACFMGYYRFNTYNLTPSESFSFDLFVSNKIQEHKKKCILILKNAGICFRKAYSFIKIQTQFSVNSSICQISFDLFTSNRLKKHRTKMHTCISFKNVVVCFRKPCSLIKIQTQSTLMFKHPFL